MRHSLMEGMAGTQTGRLWGVQGWRGQGSVYIYNVEVNLTIHGEGEGDKVKGEGLVLWKLCENSFFFPYFILFFSLFF